MLGATSTPDNNTLHMMLDALLKVTADHKRRLATIVDNTVGTRMEQQECAAKNAPIREYLTDKVHRLGILMNEAESEVSKLEHGIGYDRSVSDAQISKTAYA